MAERRMFAKTIIDSDSFLDMPLSTQALYFHLNMRADDDGFINNAKKIQRMIGASDDDLRILIGKNFIIPFETGIIVIKHWKIHNYIRNDRYKPTVYQEEKALLSEKDNKAYTLGIPNDNQMETQVRLGKVNILHYTLLYIKECCEEIYKTKDENLIKLLNQCSLSIENKERKDFINDNNYLLLMVYSINEIYKSLNKPFLDKLNYSLLTTLLLKTETKFEIKLSQLNQDKEYDYKRFLDYYIKSIKNQLEEK